ncbi:hypothetical protein CKN86_06195 [Carnobacterium divergens]|uniref:DUF1310 family protein n=1 Tax=Carnobacterium divergens TaxID=2748 RepID=UPI000D42E0EE|nr:DUF1310 family protein [Carnobacterium divergens]MCO6017040.1 DUF1310 domain-containing protein [Carnobacterium divergens]TFI62428.1 hypothetical protein CKN62_06230 [Carnobacterium divergens]TFI89630.1 hypothetical protein CKN84_06230 [Carnobacterium divergens]TFJ04685.1 hypothetical protein CKN86_06195 [Carnobacterium divergens]TFJ06175.1 hypothetical protein CKN65_06235 [Carnobacterium divergens]
MKKKLLVVIGIIVIIIIGIGGKVMLDNKKQEDRMINIVNSQEAKEVFENGLKVLDSKAFTEEGIIKSYEIDEKSIKHNPMGGINVTLFANKKSNLYVFFTLNKDENGNLTDEGGGNSSDLERLLEGK